MHNLNKKKEPLLKETIYADGDEFFSHLLKDIEQAKKCIYIETYIFKPDKLGKKVLNAIKEKASQGITIKLLIDGAGSPFFTTEISSLKTTSIQTKIYHPFPWNFWQWSKSVVKLPLILKWIYLLLNIPRRNHRKSYIIDKKIAYLGSFNVSLDHISQEHGGKGWRDTGIRLENTDLSELISAFNSCWHHRSIQEYVRETFLHVRKDPVIRLNNTRYRRRLLYRQLLKKIKLAKNKIWITNAYFIPENRILKRLKEAALRGINVNILIPRKGDTFIPIPWATALFYNSLLNSGIKIYEYLPSMLHAKSIIIDNWSTVGSSNLDYLSIFNNLEVDVRLSHKNSYEKVNQLFLQDLNKSQELTLKTWKVHHPWYKRFIGRIILYFKHFI